MEIMSPDRYYAILRELLKSGNGYTAISDLARSLSVASEEKDAMVMEMRATKKAVKKISDSSQKAKDKVWAICNLLDDEADTPQTERSE